MSKYIIEIEEKPLCVFDKDTQTYFPRLWRVKGFNSLVFDEEGLSRLEELNSDYINEHFGELQDEAYQKGINDGSLDVKLRVEGAYQRGLGDAWEAAKKIFGYEIDGALNIDELGEAFGYKKEDVFWTADIIRANTAEQAIAKLKAYEDKQADRIEVGDEVAFHHDDGRPDTVVVVTYIGDDGYIDGMDGRGTQYANKNPKRWTKTGRHFDIASILEAMRT